MSASKQQAPDSMEQACLLCRRAEADPGLCGDKVEKRGLCAHVFCLLFASGLFQRGAREAGLVGFLPEDIRRTVARAAQKHCFVCGESGAAISCWRGSCERSFHLPCAVEGGCVTQFALQYRAFCWEHRPEQAVEAVPEENTTCLICLDLVEERKSYGTMVCPACKHAWFHRGCIQGQALCAGISCFQCPLCRDRDHFLSQMLTMGIRIPLRLPSWENRRAYAELGERHSRCDARECLCPRGREQAEQEGPWQLLLCCSCAAEGTHRRCSNLTSSTASWECDACAGLGTASSASSELAGPSAASQAGSGQSLRSPAPQTSSPSTASQLPSGSSCRSSPSETSSPSTASQAASRCHERSRVPAPSAESSTPSQAAPGPSHSSPAPETSSPSTASQLPAGSSCGSPPPETSSPSTGRQVAFGPPHGSLAPQTSSPGNGASGPSQGPPVLEGSSRSSLPGPDRVQKSSRSQRRAQHPYSRPRRRRDRIRAPAPGTETSTPSQAAPGPSHSSPAPETSSPSTASQLPAGSSCGSPALDSSRSSSSPGPVRMRDRSRLQRRAQHPYSRPGRRHGTSRAPSPSAGPDPPPPVQ
ncbi:G2/M phase-specific E3 ubiquitin-protein ligase-like [Accipiter gentilis]|uniref:G2/M phase-specific E3 ubiquitin-protein ligase-like n=1 Tax=Astur gentilis TaxID=8957 RepID=UPI00211087F4|nr:G2/M phase-specific E3 ubiquitin-protein ligase-like [Accipiter gentilis]